MTRDIFPNNNKKKLNHLKKSLGDASNVAETSTITHTP